MRVERAPAARWPRCERWEGHPLSGLHAQRVRRQPQAPAPTGAEAARPWPRQRPGLARAQQGMGRADG
eukprot:11211789-Lingulodinium_polyedra.AAC.1